MSLKVLLGHTGSIANRIILKSILIIENAMLQRVTISASGEESLNTDELHRLNVSVGQTRNITWENSMGTAQGESPSP